MWMCKEESEKMSLTASCFSLETRPRRKLCLSCMLYNVLMLVNKCFVKLEKIGKA